MKRILSIILTLALLLTALPLALGVSAAEESKTYVISNFSAGTQYAKNEVHKLDDFLTITTTECHFTSELRMYSSSSHNGFAILTSPYVIKSITMDAGNKADSIKIFGSDDGATFTSTAIATVSITSSYGDKHTADLSNYNYKYLKLDVSGSQQIRIKSFTITFDIGSSCTHENKSYGKLDETYHTVTCSDCQLNLENEEHAFRGAVCICGEIEPTIDEDINENGYYLTATWEGTTYYYNGLSKSNNAGAVVTNIAEAIVLYKEVLGSDIYFYFMNDDEEKTYISILNDNNGFRTSETPCAFTTIKREGVNTYCDKASSRVPVVYLTNLEIRSYGSSSTAYASNPIMVFEAIEETACTHANEEDGEVITEATYFKEGLKEIVCADCGEFIRNEAIACDTAAPVVYTYSYDAAANALTINWTYSKAFEMDMLNATEVMFNFELAGYSKDVAINDAQLGGTVTLTGFNAERVSETLYIGLNVKISDVANTSKFDEAAVKELKAVDIANDEKLDALLEALEADAVVDGKAENTQWLVSNIAKLDLKAAKAELNVAASQELIDALAAQGGRTDRAVKLIVKIGDDFTKEIEINDLRKYTIVTISGLSFEQLNGDISVQLVFDYANNEYDFETDEIVFACGDMIADADTAAANAFVAYMN